ncbi:uncharacterized protein [Rutidosis leptorrhynchoides]|uniref:uncharacterized protein n=1 Tax=Rutidosis leptorrhynchoides TaxID=125765 RepID=UPI003A990DB0
MSYASQLKRITYDGELLHSLSCCNGKIYALNSDGFLCRMVIQVKIVINGIGEVVIQLLMFGARPWSGSVRYSSYNRDTFIRGYGKDLFCVEVYYHEITKKIVDVSLFRLDTGIVKSEDLACLKKWDLSDMTMDEVEDEDQDGLDITRVMWEEINDLKDAFFYLDLGRNGSIYYNPAVASGLGGYIHIRDGMGEILHLYHVRDRTIISSPMPLRVVSTTRVLMWEGRLEDDRVEAICTSTVEQEKDERVVTLDKVLKEKEKELPGFGYIKSLCFSAPPNSSNNCIVAGFTIYERRSYFIYSVGGAWEPSSWRLVPIDDGDEYDDLRYSLTFIGRDLYALNKDGEVFVFKNLDKQDVRKTLLAKAPPPISSSCDSQYFTMSYDDEHLLLVIVGDQFGEVEVFKRNDDADKWEKIDGIGKHTIYIGGTTSCLR